MGKDYKNNNKEKNKAKVDVIKIINKYYKINSKSYNFLLAHSKAVAKKALEIAQNVPHLKPDLRFIEEAAMLHDIGIFKTKAPGIGCYGNQPYICHGVLGRVMLEQENLPKHALVCERHVGVGITIKDIETQKLPLPKRDMIPESIEEQIICFADKFFSKHEKYLTKEKDVNLIRTELLKFGIEKVKKFDEWVKKFK